MSAHEPLQHRLRSRHRKGPGRLHRRQCAASACAGRTTAGRSSCGRRTCSTRTTCRSRSTRRSRVPARTRAVEAGFIARSTQLFGAFLGEPRTWGLTLRGKWGPSERCSAAAPAAAAAAAASGDADLPGWLGDPGDRHLPAAAATAAAATAAAGTGTRLILSTQGEGPANGGALFIRSASRGHGQQRLAQPLGLVVARVSCRRRESGRIRRQPVRHRWRYGPNAVRGQPRG